MAKGSFEEQMRKSHSRLLEEATARAEARPQVAEAKAASSGHAAKTDFVPRPMVELVRYSGAE